MEETTAGNSLHTPPPATYIPLDILCRLPVKSLLRFRCVCMSWNSLISEDINFAIKHLRLSPKRQHLVTTSWKIGKEVTVMSCPFDSRNLSSTFTYEPTLLDYSPFVSKHCDGLIASCDGLLCFAIDQRLAVLYNPSIRKLNILPYIVHPPEQASTLYAFGYAFGYDPFIHNYKVIALSQHYNRNLGDRFRVHSYTLGTESWKRIKDFPSKFQSTDSTTHGVFVSSTVNWLRHHYSYGNRTIVSLHLGKESYQEIPLPDYGNQEIPPPDYGNQYRLNLDVIRDCLCLLSQESCQSFIDVWLMKEYGNKESWIKFVHLPYMIISHSDFTQLVYISDDNNHALFVYKNDWKSKWVAVVYDIKNDTIKSYKIEDNLSMVKSKVYVESLISP